MPFPPRLRTYLARNFILPPHLLAGAAGLPHPMAAISDKKVVTITYDLSVTDENEEKVLVASRTSSTLPAKCIIMPASG